MMAKNNINHDTLECIKAMRAQEDTSSSCYNYLQSSACNNEDIDEACRKSMVVWCQQLQKALKLSPQTVWITISFFDRYLSSSKGKSQEALENQYKFQLAAITSFYIAVKIYEPVELDVATLAKLCKGYYEESKILSMETDILFALEWRVSCPTPMDYVMRLLELLPAEINSEGLLKDSQKHVEHTSNDFYFTFCKPSVVGASCLASSLAGADVLSSSERQAFWLQIARITNMIDVMEAQNRLLEGKTICQPVSVSNITKKPSNFISKVATFSRLKTASALVLADFSLDLILLANSCFGMIIN
ncbi:hypothetical protein ACHAXR_004394 [Thalassiosira sp. AJA248-18]